MEIPADKLGECIPWAAGRHWLVSIHVIGKNKGENEQSENQDFWCIVLSENDVGSIHG